MSIYGEHTTMIRSIVSHIEYAPSGEVTFVRCKPETLFTFKEGQFMMISSDFIHEGLGKPLKKPYSIATTNRELQEEGTIGFVVKKSREGFMSEYLTLGIKLGDVLHLQGPVGHMVDDGLYGSYLLISVGSGLSPMIGLYNAIKSNGGKVAMLYGERYMNQVLPSTIALLSHQNDNTKHMLFLSKEEAEGRKTGYIQDGLQEALTFLGTNNLSVFLCGHPSMVDDVREKLVAHGIDPKRIKFEKY